MLPRSIFLWLIVCAIRCSFGQQLTLGVVAGTSVTGDFRTGSATYPGGTLPDGETTYTTLLSSPVSRAFIIGPEIELKLPWRLSLEVDALHRELRSTETDTEFFSGGSHRTFGPFTGAQADWEFPILLKYRFPVYRWTPFIESGLSFRPAGSGTNVSHTGITAGAGIEIHAGFLNISPTIRYTRWSGSGTGAFPAPILNQVELLAGFTPGENTSHKARVFAGRLSIGVLAGVGFGDDLRAAQASPVGASFSERSEANSPIAGLLLEYHAWRNLFVEADGIYRPLHATDTSSEGRVGFAVLTWEFPVLAKYKFRDGARVRPLVELGPSFRLDGNFNGPTPSHYGITAGAGVETHWRRLKISPVIRYTHWAKERVPSSIYVPSTISNQVEGVVGFSF